MAETRPPPGIWRRLRMRLAAVSWRDLSITVGSVLLVSGIAIAAALHFVRPAPPRHLTIASGEHGSAFLAVAGQYQKILAKSGITLKIVATEGSLDNLDRLADPDSGIDIGLVQSGVSGTGSYDLVSLGSLFYQPLTIFYRSPLPLKRLSQLRGERIAVGEEGSGTRVLALALLNVNGIGADGPTKLLNLEGEAARRALLRNQVGAIFLTGDSAGPETIRQMLHAKDVRLFDFSQADAYVRWFRYLQKLPIPPGTFDLGENLPPVPITLLAPTVELVARPDLHPALSDLLIEAAIQVHGRATLLQNAGQFPTPSIHEFPISADAARYYKSGKSFAYRYFPFWLASLLDRAIVLLVPIVLVVLPGLRYLPTLYGWRVNSRIHRRYRSLMALEREALRNPSPAQRAALLDRLAEIEKSAIASKMPGSHAEQAYLLRQHINFVRERLRPAQPPEPAATPPPVAPAHPE